MIDITNNYLSAQDLSYFINSFNPNNETEQSSRYIDTYNEENFGSVLVEKLRNFPFFLFGIVPDSIYMGKNPNTTNIQLCHIIYEENCPKSPLYPVIDKLFADKLNILCWVRIKLNIVFSRESIIEHGFHTDVSSKVPDMVVDKDNIKTSIYYFNTNNGYTLFKDGKKIDSVQNRLITFPSSMEHTGTTCTDQPFRLVLNMNYIPLKDKIKIHGNFRHLSVQNS